MQIADEPGQPHPVGEYPITDGFPAERDSALTGG